MARYDDYFEEVRAEVARYSEADWTLVPESIRSAIRAYIEHGKNSGAYLGSAIVGDFFAAANLGDNHTLSHLAALARFASQYAPRKCWGMPDNFLT
jgi:hypothetical protein